MRPLHFIPLSVVVFAACGSAHAACVGGALIEGSFGVLISGPVNGGNTAEGYSGVLTANGRCGIAGSLTGGIFGQASATASVTGSYAVPASKRGIVKLSIGGATPVTFDIGLEKDGKAAEVTGIAVDGPAPATLKLTAITPATYALSSLKGTYVVTCTGAANAQTPPDGFGTELAYATFDGAGNLKVAVVVNNNGTRANATVTGTYLVNADGSFTIQDSGNYTRYTVAGAIVNSATETRSVLLDSTSGFGAYRTCMSKKQG